MLDHEITTTPRGRRVVDPSLPPAEGLTSKQFWLTATILAVVAASFEIQQLMVIPLMGLLSTSLDVSATVTTWIVLSALISGAILTGPLCRLADRIGPKKVYVIAATAVLVGNALCALALAWQIPALMLFGRALVGINIAAAMGIAILKSLGSPKQMQMGMGMVTLGNGLGVVPSFLLAGFLIDRGASLTTVFWVTAFLAAACVLMLLAIPQTQGWHTVRIPFLSSVLIGAWVLPICLYLSLGNSWGWASWSTLGFLVFALVAFACWLRFELASDNPLIPLRMLRGNALVGYYATACIGLLAYGYYLTASAFAQTPPDQAGYGFGVSVFESGLILIPVGILVTILGPLVGRLMHVVGPKWVLIAGSAILTLQFLLMAAFKSELWQMYAYAAMFGVGVALFLPAGWSVFAMQAKHEEIGITAGMALILQMIYGAFAAAIGTVLLTRELVSDTTFSVESGYTTVFLIYAIGMAAAVGLGFLVNTKRDGYITVDQEVTR
ncbi:MULTISPECIES: MFS transporter [Actinomycetes]|uniref:MFS transporter n=1 Tax=Actinomycetes TaxID=1760 RepID=UPI0004BF5F78|nr:MULTISPECIES: MFS transporter [Actinomycetes]